MLIYIGSTIKVREDQPAGQDQLCIWPDRNPTIKRMRSYFPEHRILFSLQQSRCRKKQLEKKKKSIADIVMLVYVLKYNFIETNQWSTNTDTGLHTDTSTC